METGAVSFHDGKQVRLFKIEKDKDIVRKIMKTKKESYPNLEEALREHKGEVEVAKNEVILAEKLVQKSGEQAAKQEKENLKDQYKDF